MNKRREFLVVALLLFSIVQGFAQKEVTTCLFDSCRNRIVPVAIYQPRKENSKTRVVIFNHGYDGNKNCQSNRTYAYLNRFLAGKGFYVISIQHELSDDSLLAMEGDFMKTRMPNWKRGEENILFIIREFKKLKPTLDWDNLTMIGHSNGGDMTMLCAAEHPELMTKAISMDHRRMLMPRVKKPQLYTLRGCDYNADKDVLPDKQEQEAFRITVVKLDGITHSDMGEKGTIEQHNLINQYIFKFINSR